MNYGMYLSASGVLTNMHRQDVYANNLSNMQTTGFKPDMVFSRQRDAVRIEDDLPFLPSNELLERLGGGVLVAPTRTDFGQGATEETGNPLDVAIEGEGFLVVQGRAGEGDARLRFTRDGRMTVGAGGVLVRVADGAPVLGVSNLPVRVDPSLPVHITSDGRVQQEGADVGRLRVVRPEDPLALVKDGVNSFRFRANDTRLADADGLVRQGAIERSGVDPLMTLMAITKAGGAVSNNVRMIEIQNEATERAVNTLGRVT